LRRLAWPPGFARTVLEPRNGDHRLHRRL
jgi:hypothetical protein